MIAYLYINQFMKASTHNHRAKFQKVISILWSVVKRHIDKFLVIFLPITVLYGLHVILNVLLLFVKIIRHYVFFHGQIDIRHFNRLHFLSFFFIRGSFLDFGTERWQKLDNCFHFFVYLLVREQKSRINFNSYCDQTALLLLFGRDTNACLSAQ